MHNYKVGDRVKYISNHWKDTETNPLWDGKYGRITGTIIPYIANDFTNKVLWDSKYGRITGTIIPYIANDFTNKVLWDNGYTNSYCLDDLEIVDYIPEDMFKM
jgi:hypothetical protein